MQDASMERRLIKTRLSTVQLQRILSSNIFTKPLFKGVYPADLLPQYALHWRQKPAIIIVNHGSSQTEGTHWSLIFFPKSNTSSAYYFDSFGVNLENNSDFKTFMNRNSKQGYEFNNVRLQDSASSACGYFVLVVAYLLARGVPSEKISSYFWTTSPHKNDMILKSMLAQML